MLTKTKIAFSAAILLAAASTTFADSLRNPLLPQFVNEVPENKIGDRYPFLEQSIIPAAHMRVTSRVMGSDTHIKLMQFTNETPENKIGDRYPFLEQIQKPARVAVTHQAKRVTAFENRLFSRTTQNLF